MRLSTRTRYGMRLVIELASRYGEGPVLLRDIARNQEISEKYLSQIILPLKSAGLVRSTRGVHGGYELAASPSEITPYDVYVTFEGSAHLVDCTRRQEECGRSAWCASRIVWQRVADAMAEALGSVTICDLIEKARQQYTGEDMYAI